MPKTLHGELARAAEREGVSLNRLIVTRLSGSQPPGEVGAVPRGRRSRLLAYALAANFVVLVGAAAAAIALLVIAYR
jgi:hypothetical protein